MNRNLSQLTDRVFTPENAWTALALVAAIAAAAASRHLLEAGWRTTTGTEPPSSLESEDPTLVQSLTWGIVTGAIVGVVRVLSQRGTSALRQRT